MYLIFSGTVIYNELDNSQTDFKPKKALIFTYGGKKMKNNKEIRQKMETYRTILLVLNWIFAITLFIFGIVLADSRYTQSIGVGLIVGSFISGIIGHFLINVALAVPFILLNNGDILESIKGKTGSEITNSVDTSTEESMHNDSGEEDIGYEEKIVYYHKVIKETELKNSLSSKPKTYRLLKIDEKVNVEHTQNREDLGGEWAFINTEAKDSGWCLLNALTEIDT
jgi:hypothetical protein